MFRIKPGEMVPLSQITQPALVLGLFSINCLFNIISNTSFKLSAESPNMRSFLLWQVAGNLTGFITVLALTGLLRFLPLNIVFPVTTGLTLIGVQVIVARVFFGEDISLSRWLGTLLIVAGMLLITRK